MTHITLEQANAVIAAVLADGKARDLRPLSVAVLDGGGHLVAFQRQDRSSTLRPKIAVSKASGALGMGFSSRKLGDMAAERPAFIASLMLISADGLTPAAGGVIVVGADGLAIGAVGVTGDTSDNDEMCALAGIAAAGLVAQA